MTQATIPAPAAVTPAAGAALDAARFIELVTFRRTGDPVGTPVLFVPDGRRLLIRTADGTGKLKRLAHTARVEVTPSDSRGRRTGPTWSGTARVLGPDAIADMRRRLNDRYRIAGPLSSAVRRLRGERDVIVEVVLDAVP